MKKLQIALIVIGVVIISVLFCGNRTTLYTVKNAKENNDIVDIHGKVTNLDKMEQFYNNVENGIAETIRITRYNAEGEAIIYDVDYDGNKIMCTIDRTRDSTAKEEEKKKKSSQYDKLRIVTKENTIEYYLVGKDQEDLNLLVISK